ncbi:MAG: hypothetical protein E4H28_04110 [Gemmatimonadales bacterium]|nr:MAG: hypothetical protein E4H28_04110 [Gemmatimonadales bacterium]
MREPTDVSAQVPVARMLNAVAASLMLLAVPVSAQTSRLSTVPPVADIRQGDALVGLGLSYGLEQSFPLSGLRGDLLVLGRMSASYALADHALLELDMETVRVLWIDEAGPASVPPTDAEVGGSTAGFGDLRLGLTFAPFTLGSDISFGGWFAVELPNSDQRSGIGTNTTNILLGPVVSIPGDRLTVTSRLGVGILESPLVSFTQDDVFVYSLDALIRAGDGLRFVLSVDGRTNPRRTVSLGLEDVGLVRAGMELGRGHWRLDAGIARGYAQRSPNWRASVGLSRVTRAAQSH